MITGFFLQLLFSVGAYIVGVLPQIPFPSEILVFWTTIIGLMNSVNFLFPIHQLFAALAIAFTFHFAMIWWYHGHMAASIVRGR